MRSPKVPKGFKIPELQHPTDAFTKLYIMLRNLDGNKYHGRDCFYFLKDVLIDRVWEPLTIDTCLFTKSEIIIIVYVDNAILLSPSK